MAALGTIRKRGGVLVAIIGLGLFAFIAEEFFRSCESTRNEQRQQVGEVLGEKVNVQDFQKLVDEYTEVIKMQQGQQSLNDEQLNQDRKSTRLNSSHANISYAVFCLKKKNKTIPLHMQYK